MADAPTGGGRLPVERASVDGARGSGSVSHQDLDDGPPVAVREAALRAFDLRIAGARIADAVYDSWAVDPHGEIPLGPRLLRFACPGRIVEVGVFPQPEGATLRLRTTPAAATPVEVRHQEASVTFVTDRSGVLDLAPCPTGVLCFVLRADGETPVQTAWVRL